MKLYVVISLRKNWAGDRYLLFATEEHGKVAEIDFYPDHYRIYGYEDIVRRKTKKAAFNNAKKQISTFLQRIGDTREVEYVDFTYLGAVA